VLFFGLLRPYKGLGTLLDAWGEALDAQLRIVGQPRMPLEPLRRRAATSVSFAPRFVSDGQLAACFRRADLVVLPYAHTERFDQSGVLATALAFGKPVLASDIGGFSELAATGAVRLTRPGDLSGLRSSLQGLLAAPDELEAMAAAATAAAQGPFSWRRAAADSLSVYETVRSAAAQGERS
jgi:glycosyltransferase involved in cell wall biosynthesis